MNEIIVMELTTEEVQMIMKERAIAERQMKRESYVAELNDLIKRIKADGFTFAANHPFGSCEKISHAICWSDASKNWIGLR